MSFDALRYAATQRGLTPTQKLVLFQIADAHSARTGQCNPSPARIAQQTGLTSFQVRRAVRDLLASGVLTLDGRDFEFPITAPAPLPANWQPSDATVQALLDAYPRHHFDLQDAVHDFLAYWQNRAPAYPDDAFYRSVASYLSTCPAGPVAFAGRTRGSGPPSLRALLSGRRAASAPQL